MYANCQPQVFTTLYCKNKKKMFLLVGAYVRHVNWPPRFLNQTNHLIDHSLVTLQVLDRQ